MLNYDQPTQPIAILLPLDMKLSVFLGDKVKGGIAVLTAHITVPTTAYYIEWI